MARLVERSGGGGQLFHRLCSPEELDRAFADVLRHYRQGREPLELREFQRERGGRIEALARDLRSKKFIPSPAALIYIPKPGKPGERREISLTGPEDRIVLTALNRILQPIFERQFSNNSFAYRPGRSALGAIERVTQGLRQGLHHVAGADIDDFFGNIRRDLLLDALRKTIWEQNVIDLLETYLHIGAAAAGTLDWVDSGIGVAQGSPLSPLLSNLFLHPFDEYLRRELPARGVALAVRYADNFLLLSGVGPEAAAAGLASAEAFLAEQCGGLRVNADSRIHASVGLVTGSGGFEFLGFQFHSDGRRTMSVERLNRKKQALTELVQRAGWSRKPQGHPPHTPESLDRLVEEIAESAKGWRQYYGAVADTSDQLRMLEQHLFDVLTPWLQSYRAATGTGKSGRMKVGELKAKLLELELPWTREPRQKVKWVELLLARSRPPVAAGAAGGEAGAASPPPAARLSEQARKAIERRRREIQRRKDELEEIIISKPGAYLGRTGERLLIRRDGKKQHEIPLSAVRNISWLSSAAGSMSTDLMVAAAARGISIHILGRDGKPEVRIGPLDSPAFHLSAAQVKLAVSVDGLRLAAAMVGGKVKNQANVLRYFGKYRDRRNEAKVETETGRAS